MKKLFFVMLVVLIAAGIAAAQNYTSGTGLTGIDILGAHQNGGRGCAGCHAPHSGAAGGGGNVATNAAAFNDPLSGSNALFGQDVTPLLGLSITFAGGLVEALPGEATAYSTQEDELRQITMCLACHDGAVAKGQMMNGQAWEQRMNLLPSSVYGTRSIPTLLGNDSGNGNASLYSNDHPVGTQATLAKAHLWSANASRTQVTITVANGAISSIAPATTAYTNFTANYGYPALAGSPWGYGVSLPNGATDASGAFLTCTTCHNQHAMYVYVAPSGKQSGSKIAGGTYPTYFFINAPYTPGAVQAGGNATLAGSATQFCRQCHFGEANESFGINNVATQF